MMFEHIRSQAAQRSAQLTANPLIRLVRPDRFERPTLWFEAAKQLIINNLHGIASIAVPLFLLRTLYGWRHSGVAGLAMEDNRSVQGPRTISGTLRYS